MMLLDRALLFGPPCTWGCMFTDASSNYSE